MTSTNILGNMTVAPGGILNNGGFSTTFTCEDIELTFRLHERLVETFRLPDDADLDEITASYEHGTLELRVLRAPLESRRVAIGGIEVGRIHPDVAPI